MKKNIILIGYMGCGKTTVGKSLARLESAIFWILMKESKRNRAERSVRSSRRIRKRHFVIWRLHI